MRKKILVDWINFDFMDFPEKDFSILKNIIFKKKSETNSWLIKHLIDLECFSLGFESNIFQEKIEFLKKEYWATSNIQLAQKIFDKNLERFNIKTENSEQKEAK